MLLASKQGLALPASDDDLLPMFAASGRMGVAVVVFFSIGIVAASFSSADSALTSLTTSYCVDICERPDDEVLRKSTHVGMSIIFVVFILLFRIINSTSVIDAIYIMCSYTYGPLLGLFAYGLLTKRQTNDKFVPYIAVASPLVCYLIDFLSVRLWNYHFGYELLMLNGLITFFGLYVISFWQKPSVRHT
jgi:Na+/proline symporter